jgi:hypothetical protein
MSADCCCCCHQNGLTINETLARMWTQVIHVAGTAWLPAGRLVLPTLVTLSWPKTATFGDYSSCRPLLRCCK